MPVPGSESNSLAPASVVQSKSPLLLLKDRTDTFATTLLELVQLDRGQRYVIAFQCLLFLVTLFIYLYLCFFELCYFRFHSMLAEILQMEDSIPLETRAQIQRCFEKLFSNRGVSLVVSDKQNERNFIQNMRDCVGDLHVVSLEVSL